MKKFTMVKVWRIALLLSFLSYGLVSCSNPFNPLNNQDTELTPEGDEEAELIALCLSGELSAPDDLYNRVLRDLAVIRVRFGDEYESIQSIRFRPPWVVGCIIMSFNDSTADEVANGEYHAWDELNQKYQVTEIDTSSIRYKWIVLYFKDKLHPRRLSELYGALPGVRYAEPNHIFGDSPNVYPRQTRLGITYLFRNAWGDLPSGALCNEYWYFTVYEWIQAIFIGHWDPYRDPKEPGWWDEARKNIELYRSW